MLFNGNSLLDINNNLHLWNNLPNYLNNVTKNECFTIEHLQCCKKPAYRIVEINEDRRLILTGKGNWNGYSHIICPINFEDLTDPQPANKLYIYKNEL